MSDERDSQLASFVLGLFLGAAIGASAAILSAPQSGRKTRRRLGRAASGTRKRIGRTAQGIRKGTGDRFDDFTDEVKGRVDDAISVARKKLGTNG